MSIVLGLNHDGTAENTVVRIYRDIERHEVRDLNVGPKIRKAERMATDRR